MMVRQTDWRPDHLPPPWPDQTAYDRLYREIDPFPDYAETTAAWHEARIPSRLSAAEVCGETDAGAVPGVRRDGPRRRGFLSRSLRLP
jgi:hypothetical protein